MDLFKGYSGPPIKLEHPGSSHGFIGQQRVPTGYNFVATCHVKSQFYRGKVCCIIKALKHAQSAWWRRKDIVTKQYFFVGAFD